MLDDNVLLVNYEPTTEKLFATYTILLLIPFISFIIIRVGISLII